MRERPAVIVPPQTIGMLGGGQLGSYALVAARRMGLRTVVLDPDPNAPAGRIADLHIVAAFDDPVALEQLAGTCAAVTTEFENAPARSLRQLAEAGLVVAPNADAVSICQDRWAEKEFLRACGAPIGPLAVIATSSDLAAASTLVSFPAILKTARLGYDGKGQRAVLQAEDLPAAWAALGSVTCVLEQRLALDAEISVVLARGHDGAIACFPVAENHHVDGILDLTVVPARITEDLAEHATSLAIRIAEELGYVGVLAIEMFVVDGEVLVNEMAPRPHNSGHWSLDGARTSQFEQQIRALCGDALGSASMTASACAMVNLLGDRWANGEPDWDQVTANTEARLHLYGKHDARSGRKMGHITVVHSGRSGVEEAAELAIRLRSSATR